MNGSGCIGSIQTGLPQAVPALVVLHHADDLHAVALAGVVLTEDEEVVLLPRKEAAPYIQLHGNRPAGKKPEIRRVVLHHNALFPFDFDGAADHPPELVGNVLHPGQTALGILEEIGRYGL